MRVLSLKLNLVKRGNDEQAYEALKKRYALNKEKNGCHFISRIFKTVFKSILILFAIVGILYVCETVLGLELFKITKELYEKVHNKTVIELFTKI